MLCGAYFTRRARGAQEDARLGREVAVKVIPSGRHQESALQRFAVEARAAGSINHPNILAVYDIGTYEGGPYLVSELLQGKTLREVLDGKPLPLPKTIDYATQLAQGLSSSRPWRGAPRSQTGESVRYQ